MSDSTIQPGYIGRFAPSPTGPVHIGTLLAAVGSYLQAKMHNGHWLLRIEDVDVLRNVEGSDRLIIQTLEDYGFEWDGDIIYQTQRTRYYQEALDALLEKHLIFPCSCSRKQLARAGHDIYPGTCRQRHFSQSGLNNREHAIRIRADAGDIAFNDSIVGEYHQNLYRECGDFVIRRRDGLFAYQLAVVVDDAFQGITEVVRGADLLSSTPRQIYLQQQLGFDTPQYCHLPLVIDQHGNKISKTGGAAAVSPHDRVLQLVQVVNILDQQAPRELETASIDEFWSWAITHWNINKVPTANIIVAVD